MANLIFLPGLDRVHPESAKNKRKPGRGGSEPRSYKSPFSFFQYGEAAVSGWTLDRSQGVHGLESGRLAGREKAKGHPHRHGNKQGG